MRGKSLRPVIERPQEPGHEFVVSEMANGPARSFMVRTKRYKYMVFPAAGGEKQEMFFDMQADPGEMKNLAGQPALAAEVARHGRLLADWNRLTEEADHPIRPNPQAQRARKNQAKQNQARKKKAKQKDN
jgi:arylsulfatase A-like enzyme